MAGILRSEVGGGPGLPGPGGGWIKSNDLPGTILPDWIISNDLLVDHIGRSLTAHVTLARKQERAQAKVVRSEAHLLAARTHVLDTIMLEDATEDPLYAQVALEAAGRASEAVSAAEKAHAKALRAASHQESMPREIFQRDTTRENVGTVLKMMMLALIEWVLREYFAGAKMEVQTFLAYFMYLPVETRTSWHTVRHRIDVTALRDPQAAMVDRACEEITKRRIKVDGRRLRLETFRQSVENH